jgi:hypothetical protein
MFKKTKVVLSFDERRHFAAFFVILINVDKRLKAEKRKAKRKSKPKLKCGDISSLNSELFLC